MRSLLTSLTVCTLLSCGVLSSACAQSLQGSTSSIRRQNLLAVDYKYTFLQNAQAVSRFVEHGYLVRVQEKPTLEIHNVSYPYARPEVKLFLERLSEQYHAACGQRLTVTSLTRPQNRQPNNASDMSVHPTGMAVDLRIPAGKCRAWLESTLLYLEREDVLDVTRERYPPHYHVAVFTKQYADYVANMDRGVSEYVVRRGDTLSSIADRNGTTVPLLRAANGLGSNLIRVGQRLQIPAADGGQVASAPELTHRVRRGDTLWRIASLYGTTVGRIRAENGLVDDFLQVGQELRLSLSQNSN